MRSATFIFLISPLLSSWLFIPMDSSQDNHLKAYGIVYTALSGGTECEWLLNYRGGSFIIPFSENIKNLAIRRGVSTGEIGEENKNSLIASLQAGNMHNLRLEKAPRIAIYTPEEKNPWADAVTIALTYAQIPYDTLWDKEVLAGKLGSYDWLHLHHEDFTGQYSKFFYSYAATEWMLKKKALYEKLAHEAGFDKVSRHKLASAHAIREFTLAGGFLFAMCCAPETIDIALAAADTDILEAQIDGDGIDPAWQSKLDFSRTFAFYNFHVETGLLKNNYSDIDYNQVNTPLRREADDFELFEFSAKIDPIPCLLIQNHINLIKGFFGQSTSFRIDKIKDGVILLGRNLNGLSAQYLYGSFGKGSFTFLGGHDPEDRNHFIGDKETNLELYRNSPGYRLILNNILFPSARPKEKKT
ncbi:MAG: asparagine synthetase B [Spirochaetes bacterium GWF1_41_5]|nr:MAG: asparagine synthetase B [Spirochaetes bacterium GWF1_41_5]HBE04066.1 asparagine synthetase B [Spirochaetia bacterium]